MAWHPETGQLYATEHGAYRFDELNRIVPRRNYGWGSYQCDERMDGDDAAGEVTFPILCFRHWNISPSGMEYVSDRDSPWYGSLFVASLRGKHLHRYVIDGDRIVANEVFYYNDGRDAQGQNPRDSISRRFRDVEYRDGALYVIGDMKGMVRLTPAEPGSP